MILICIPILTLPILLETLPVQHLTINKSNIQRFLLHKIFFVFSSPILYLSYQGELYFLKLFPVFNEGGLQDFLLVSFFWLFIIPWILITLYLWELVFGKDSSNTLKQFRMRQLRNKSSRFSNNDFSVSIENNQLIYSRRWLMIVIGLPLLIIIFGTLIFFNELLFNWEGFFFIDASLFSALDLCLFLLMTPFYKKFLIKNGFQLKILNEINNYLFGLEDISFKALGYGMTFLFISLIITTSYQLFSDSLFKIFAFYTLYLVSILVFLVTIWINQIKNFLGIKNDINDEFD